MISPTLLNASCVYFKSESLQELCIISKSVTVLHAIFMWMPMMGFVLAHCGRFTTPRMEPLRPTGPAQAQTRLALPFLHPKTPCPEKGSRPFLSVGTYVCSWPSARIRKERGGVGRSRSLISSLSGLHAFWPKQRSLLWRSCASMLTHDQRRVFCLPNRGDNMAIVLRVFVQLTDLTAPPLN